MSESSKTKRKVAERRPAGIKAMPAPPPRTLPDDHPARSLFKEVARDEAAPAAASTSTTLTTPTTPTTTTTTPTTPAAPARDFMRVANSIVRDALPAGFFTGKRKQIYDYLYSVTRGAVVPKRTVRITMETLAIKADVGSDRTLRKHLRRLMEVGLLSVTEIGGTQGGNEFTVFIPEEIIPTTSTTPTTATTPYHPHHQSPNVPVVPVVESDSGTGGLSVDTRTFYGEPKTSFKTNTDHDDDEAFADFAAAMKKAVREVTGREPSAAEASRWAELAEVLATELKIAAGRTTVSSAPAFLAEHLRRRLWKKEKRQIDAEAAEQKASTPATKLDVSKCPDCFGTTMYYPEGFEKGVARCHHSKLTAEGAG